jgi:hypothetical protein
MAQSPTDMGQASDASRAPGRYATATLAMNPPAGEGNRKPAESARPDQLCETMPLSRPAAEHERETEEPSIEEYMAALLERTRQYSTAPTQEIPTFVRPAVAPKTPPAAPVTPPSPVPASPTPAAECRDAISELRELANISARSSFNTHRAQHLVQEMRGKRFVAVVAMLTSIVLLSLSSSVQSPAYISAVAAVTTACAFSLKFLALGRELAWLCAEPDLNGRTEN